jgi:hypothetical protein
MNTDTERARFEAAKAKALAGIDYAMNWRNNSPSAVKFATGLADARQFVIDAALPSAPSEGPSDKERVKQLEDAIRWALGEGDDFPPCEEGQGKYWWRTELRRRAAIKASTP